MRQTLEWAPAGATVISSDASLHAALSGSP
jgi:hypothetical protein